MALLRVNMLDLEAEGCGFESRSGKLFRIELNAFPEKKCETENSIQFSDCITEIYCFSETKGVSNLHSVEMYFLVGAS